MRIMEWLLLCCRYNEFFFGDLFYQYGWPIIASIFAGLIVLVGDDIRRKKALESKYGKAAGQYDCYGFKENEKNGNKEISEHLEKNHDGNYAIIEYKGTNVLKINLFEETHKHEWEGEIMMETETKGSIAFRYVKLHGKQLGFEAEHKFGIKHCIVREDEKESKMYVYLIGEKWLVEKDGHLKIEGYGKEVLIRDIEKR